MEVIAIIPARMNSSRFKDKPLKKILSIPMIGHCYFRCKIALGSKNVFVATCDKKIKDYVMSIGGNVVMTSKAHKRASTRTAEALMKIEKKLNKKIDVILMYQGDEPLGLPKNIRSITKLFNNKSVGIVNLIYKSSSYKMLSDKNNVKVVTDKYGKALYFTREMIPSPWLKIKNYSGLIQTGIIAFRRNKLMLFNKTKETPLEILESVDLNRVIENSEFIHTVMSENINISVDNINDLKNAEKYMRKDPVYLKYK